MKEDDRITTIGNYVRDHPGEKVGVVTDDEPGKPERYIHKLTTRFDCVEIIESVRGPSPGMWTITVKKKGVPLKPPN